MKSNYQNTSMLDMVFENRNQSYGAYVIRKEADERIKKAFAITIGSILLVMIGNLISERLTKQEHPRYVKGIHDVIDVTHLFDKPKIEVKPNEVPKVKPKASASNTEMKVVSDRQAATDTFASREELKKFDSGLTTNTSVAPDNLGKTDGTGSVESLDLPVEPPVEPGFKLIAEVMPRYKGGDEALMRYLGQETNYPIRERDLEIEGKAFVRFVVNTDGYVSNVESVRSDSPGFAKEAIRVTKTLKFEPGMQSGVPVRVQMVLPFVFRLNN